MTAMKQSSQNSSTHLLLFLFMLLLISYSSKLSAATFLVTKHDGIQEEQTLKEMTITTTSTEGTFEELERSESVDELMGLEDCGKEGDDDDDEECLKGRIIAEAHLDYIYTQHQKP
ncbi:phytosulfokines 2-like [Humulus lupulus]|uniref:phytosulfokines 2-like n=1 Tax=Humulus lupulus TaxID=3486 RepID=UPI002B40E6CB|nr:phytosulfokines 2-like [Humulus lupulus]